MPKEQSLPADSHDAWHNLWIMAPQPLTQGESRLEAEFHPSNLEDEAFDRSTYMFRFLIVAFVMVIPKAIVFLTFILNATVFDESRFPHRHLHQII